MHNCMILYHSHHHNNTQRVVHAVTAACPWADAVPLPLAQPLDLTGYELVGLASGFYMNKPHADVLNFAAAHREALRGKRVFTLLTSGSNSAKYSQSFRQALEALGLTVAGGWQCKGFDTFGPFRLIGGIAKGHPDPGELAEAVSFVEGLRRKDGPSSL